MSFASKGKRQTRGANLQEEATDKESVVGSRRQGSQKGRNQVDTQMNGLKRMNSMALSTRSKTRKQQDTNPIPSNRISKSQSRNKKVQNQRSQVQNSDFNRKKSSLKKPPSVYKSRSQSAAQRNQPSLYSLRQQQAKINYDQSSVDLSELSLINEQIELVQ